MAHLSEMGSFKTHKTALFALLPLSMALVAVATALAFGIGPETVGYTLVSAFCFVTLFPARIRQHRHRLLPALMFLASCLCAAGFASIGAAAGLIYVIAMPVAYTVYPILMARGFAAWFLILVAGSPLYAGLALDSSLLLLSALIAFQTVSCEWIAALIKLKRTQTDASASQLRDALTEADSSTAKLEKLNREYLVAITKLDVANQSLKSKQESLQHALEEVQILNEEYESANDALIQANNELCNAQHLASAYLDHTNAAVIIRNVRGEVVAFNQAAEFLFQALNLHLGKGSTVFAPDVHPEVAWMEVDGEIDITRVDQCEGTSNVTVHWAEGIKRHFLVSNRCIEAAGEILWVYGWVDCTVLIEARAEVSAKNAEIQKVGLALSEERAIAAAYLEAAKDPVVVRDENNELVALNGAAQELFSQLGLNASAGSADCFLHASPQLISSRLTDPPEDAPNAEQRFELVLTLPETTPRIFQVASTKVEQNGAPLTVNRLYDLTEVYAAKEQKAEAESKTQRINEVFDRQPTAAAVLSAQSDHIDIANDAFVEMFKEDRSAAAPITSLSQIPPNFRSIFQSLIGDALKTTDSAKVITQTMTCAAARTYQIKGQALPDTVAQDSVLITVDDITDTLSYERQIDELSSIFFGQAVPAAVWRLSEPPVLAYMNQAMFNLQREIILGDTTAELIGKPYKEVYGPQVYMDTEALRSNVLEMARQRNVGSIVLPQMKHHHGHRYQLEYSALDSVDPSGDRLLTTTYIDVTERENAREKALNLLQQITAIIITHDKDWNILSCNDAWREQLGYDQDDTEGQNLLSFIPEHLHSAAEHHRSMMARSSVSKPTTCKMKLKDKQGGVRIFEISSVSSGEGLDRVFYATLFDVTDREDALKKIQHQLHYDHLTKVRSRRGILDWYEKEGSKQENALYLFDLDHFKSVNDTCGHDAGDRLLRACAQSVQQAVGPDVLVGRLGGEEFVVIDLFQSWDNSATMAERILAAIRATEIETGYGRIQRTASMGVARLAVGADLSEGLALSDAALETSKDNGRDLVTLMTPEFQDAILRDGRFVTEFDMKKALEDGEIYYVVQPILNPLGTAPVGFEALLRWRKADGSHVSPATFQGILYDVQREEKYRNIIKDLRKSLVHSLSYFADAYIAFNHRVEELASPEACASLIQSFEEIKDTDERVFLIELSERSLVSRVNMEQVIESLHTLRAQGFLVALDDFGVEASNLVRLAELPIDVIKLDKALIDWLESDRKALEVVRSTTIMASKLHINVVAEGIETIEQARIIARMSGVCQQGFLHAKPMTVPDLFNNLMEIGTDLRPYLAKRDLIRAR